VKPRGRFDTVDRAFHIVRKELCELGLLEKDVYLDGIDLVISALPGFGTCGWVYDVGVDAWRGLWGFQGGTIYVPRDLSIHNRRPGMTVLDVIRHEFGHAWYWQNPGFFRGRWFREAFGAGYQDEWETQTMCAEYRAAMKREAVFRRSAYYGDYVSPYAMTMPKEDFAETFMCFLRNRNSLTRFRRRPGLYRKLQAVKRAVANRARYVAGR
jgi:hypothetical protein